MKPSKQALQVVQALKGFGGIYVRGVGGLRAVREAVRFAMKAGGLTISFDPVSEPALVDYLSIPVITALDDALIWALVGTMVGTIAGRPALGLAVGTAAGLGIGAARGTQLVRQGWRIRAVRDPNGIPLLMVTANR